MPASLRMQSAVFSAQWQFDHRGGGKEWGGHRGGGGGGGRGRWDGGAACRVKCRSNA